MPRNFTEPDRFQRVIDDALDRYSRFDADCPAHLEEAIRYALLGPGKRLRPRLVLLASEVCGGDVEQALPAACAVEMIHAYSLVHDDLPAMDDDDYRRGRLTCHKAHGEDIAILVGDALQARAFELLATEIRDSAIAARCCALLANAAGATALVGGQAADLARQSCTDLESLESIHSRKTGALFRVSLALGAVIAGASPRQFDALQVYGHNIGMAFQITDDLLDVNGQQQLVGKRLRKDVQHGTATFPKLLGIEESRRRAAEAVARACNSLELFNEAADQLRQLAQFVLDRNR